MYASKSGAETTLLASDAESGIRMEIDGSKFITSQGGLSSPTSAPILRTLSCYACAVTTSFIRERIGTVDSFVVELTADNSYIIDRTADGRRLNISQSVRMVGNSVSPPPLAALARANLDSVLEDVRKAA